MPNGINRAAGSPTTVKLEGKTYIMEPLTLRDFGIIENEYLKRRPNPLKAVAEVKDILAEEDYEKLLTQAYRDATNVSKASPQEISEWLDTRDGVVFSIWLSLRKNHPELTKEMAEAAIQQMGEEQLKNIAESRDVASGVDELGNSTGLSTGQEKVKTTRTSSRGGRGKSRKARAPKRGR
jgi:hypothetical protein